MNAPLKKIGKYELIEEVGRGGMGVVYKAYDPIVDRQVALKVLSDRALEVPETKQRFYREARMAGKLSHVNITTVFDVGEADGKTYIVMEYLHGDDLKTIISNRRPLSLAKKLEYGIQISEGLLYAHAHNIVHRDIKPENIKIVATERIKIIDFGIAKPHTIAGEGADKEAELTQIGTRIGTPLYMSPEQVRGQRVDRRSDIFSFGVLMYELLTYKRPFVGNDTVVMYKICHEEPEEIRLEESDLSASLQAFVSRCLAKNPDDRFDDCGEVLNALQILLESAKKEMAIQHMLTEGRDLLQQDLLNKASVVFSGILQLDPDNGEALSQLKRISDTEKERTKAKIFNGAVQSGDIIAHFRLLEYLGGGGMGVVYKAEDVVLKRPVALKFLKPELTSNPEAKARFLTEAQAASSLDHPNICTIHEIGETDNGLLFICMAFYEGRLLRKHMAEGVASVAEALAIALRVANGLAVAHERNITHRDIKPDNIMLTEGGEAKIIDFGLAKLTGESGVTRAGTVMGTPAYMSPEQVRGEEVGPQSDIWSFGVLLYELLTGIPPFDGHTIEEMLDAILQGDPMAPRSKYPEIPPGLEAVVMSCLAKRRENRYATMREVVRDLTEVEASFSQEKRAEAARLEEIQKSLKAGSSYLEHRNYQKAQRQFEAVLRLDPRHREAIELLDLCKTKEEQRKRIDRLLEEGESCFKKEKFDLAAKALEEILSLDPENLSAQRYRDEIGKRRQRTEQIDTILTEASAHERSRAFTKAIDRYEHVLRIDPHNEAALRGVKRSQRALAKAKPASDKPGGPPVAARPRNKAGTLWLVGAAIVAVAVVILVLRNQPGRQAEKDSVITQTNGMHILKERALTLEAESWSKELFQNGVQKETEGDEALARDEFAAARRSYGEASEYYKRAAEDAANRKRAASIDDLKRMANDARESMLKEKSVAEKLGTRAKRTRNYENGMAKEREAAEYLKGGDRESIEHAREAFHAAENEYRQVVSFIALTTHESERNLASRDTPPPRNAEPAASQPAPAKQEVPPEPAPDSHTGQPNEKVSPTQLAATETPPLKREPDRRAIAENGIQDVLERCRTGLESGNVNTMKDVLKFSPSEEESWSTFFHVASNVKAKIELVKEDIDPDATHATVTARIILSYFNTSVERQEHDSFLLNLQLASTNGQWSVVPQQ